MNTKFTQVVKIKKQNLDKIEISLAKSRAKKNRLDALLSSAISAINGYNLPKRGDFNVLRQAIEDLRLLKAHKDDISEKIELTKKEIAHFEFQYKNAFIEYEKMSYLDQMEIKAKIAKIKRQEAVILDEIAVQRYSFIKANE